MKDVLDSGLIFIIFLSERESFCQRDDTVFITVQNINPGDRRTDRQLKGQRHNNRVSSYPLGIVLKKVACQLRHVTRILQRLRSNYQLLKNFET